MSDLVKRLRSENTMHGYYDAPEIQIEAANCIETQAARIAELEAKNKMIADYIACDCDSFDDCFNDVSSQDKCPCFIARAALEGGKQ